MLKIKLGHGCNFICNNINEYFWKLITESLAFSLDLCLSPGVPDFTGYLLDFFVALLITLFWITLGWT